MQVSKISKKKSITKNNQRLLFVFLSSIFFFFPLTNIPHHTRSFYYFSGFGISFVCCVMCFLFWFYPAD